MKPGDIIVAEENKGVSTRVDTSSEWYRSVREEVKTASIEGEFGWRWALIESRHEIGKIVATASKENKVSVLSLVKELSADLKLSFRTLYYCVSFYNKFPDLADAPFSKNISFRDIIGKYLTDQSAKKDEKEAKRETPQERRLPRVKDCADATEAWIKYIKESGCLICGQPAEPHHWPHTRGAGGKAWECIPLCREHHSQYQDYPDLLWGNAERSIMDFLYTTILIMFKAYVAKEKDERT